MTQSRGQELEQPTVGLLGAALDAERGDVRKALLEPVEQDPQLLGLAGDARPYR